ncbi:MAG: hypothetical protein TECD_00438 [Hyphomicrobiaceae bacterium hypho_1]
MYFILYYGILKPCYIKRVVTNSQQRTKIQYLVVILNLKKDVWYFIVVMANSYSHYPTSINNQQVVKRTLSILVDNEPGVLARVIGMFSGRGYNIDSLTVTETEHEKHISRITIVTRGTPEVIEQIKNQLKRVVPIHCVIDLTYDADPVERELALIKVICKGDKQVELLRLAEIFKAQVVDASTVHFVLQITGRSADIDRFIELMMGFGLVELVRTGIAAIGRGKDSLK